LNFIDYRESQDYQSIFENAMEGIFQSSVDGRFLKINSAMARIYGYESPEEMVRSVSNISKNLYVDNASREFFVEKMSQAGHVEGFEARNYRKDGSIIWTRTNARTVRDGNGNILYFEGFLTDITSSKEVEFALRESEEKYRALVERLPGAVFLDKPDNPDKAFFVSSKIKDILGYSQDEWICDINWFDIIHPEDLDRIKIESEISDRAGSLFCQEYRLRKKNGEYIWIREETSLVKDDHGEPLFWQGFFPGYL
jgi:PAS domain S-box-containing protein